MALPGAHCISPQETVGLGPPELTAVAPQPSCRWGRPTLSSDPLVRWARQIQNRQQVSKGGKGAQRRGRGPRRWPSLPRRQASLQGPGPTLSWVMAYRLAWSAASTRSLDPLVDLHEDGARTPWELPSGAKYTQGRGGRRTVRAGLSCALRTPPGSHSLLPALGLTLRTRPSEVPRKDMVWLFSVVTVTAVRFRPPRCSVRPGREAIVAAQWVGQVFRATGNSLALKWTTASTPARGLPPRDGPQHSGPHTRPRTSPAHKHPWVLTAPSSPPGEPDTWEKRHHVGACAPARGALHTHGPSP